MATNFNTRKIYGTVERMDSSEYLTELTIVPLKEHKARTYFCLEINILLLKKITQTMNDCTFSGQNNYRILQRMDDFHYFCYK